MEKEKKIEIPQNQIVVSEISTGKTRRIVVSSKDYKNNKYFDIRAYEAMTGGQNWYPTKKGITIHMDRLADVVSALCAIAEGEGVSHGQNPAGAGQPTSTVS